MLGASHECNHCQSKYLIRRSDRLVRCEDCDTIVEESVTSVKSMLVHREVAQPLQMVTPLNLTMEQRTFLLSNGLPSGFVTMQSMIVTEPYHLFYAMPSSMPADVLDLERRFSSFSTSEGSTPKKPAASVPATPATPAGAAPQSPAPSGAKQKAPTAKFSTKNLLIGYYIIQRVAQTFQLDHRVFDTAFEMFRITMNNAVTKKVEGIAAGAIRLAMDKYNKAQPFNIFCQAVGGMTPSEVHEGANRVREAIPPDLLKKETDINNEAQARMIHQIKHLSEQLQLSPRAQERANLFVKRVIDRSITTRRNPRSVSAACLYLACTSLNETRTQAQVCQAAAISEGTLRTIVAELKRKIDELIPEDEIQLHPEQPSPAPATVETPVNNLAHLLPKGSPSTPASLQQGLAAYPSRLVNPAPMGAATPLSPLLSPTKLAGLAKPGQANITNFFKALTPQPPAAPKETLSTLTITTPAPSAQRTLFPVDLQLDVEPSSAGVKRKVLDEPLDAPPDPKRAKSAAADPHEENEDGGGGEKEESDSDIAATQLDNPSSV